MGGVLPMPKLLLKTLFFVGFKRRLCRWKDQLIISISISASGLTNHSKFCSSLHAPWIEILTRLTAPSNPYHKNKQLTPNVWWWISPFLITVSSKYQHCEDVCRISLAFCTVNTPQKIKIFRSNLGKGSRPPMLDSETPIPLQQWVICASL